MVLKWISEAEALPLVAERVFLALPRQQGDFWDVFTARLLLAHEGAVPLPVKPGSRWPTQYWWGRSDQDHDNVLVTGNSWWARLDEIPLPPGAEHYFGGRGEHVILQVGDVWVGQAERG